MPQINLCFLWHMHQPFYKDLASGEYKLPWTRMHALKDYYGMVRILEEFPKVKQTFNLVPSMMAQVEEYASGAGARSVPRPRPQARRAPDRRRARAPAAALVLFRSRAHDLPLSALRRALRCAQRTEERPARAHMFSTQELRDVQMWSQLAWFDEEFQANDPEVREWIERGRNFTLDDQRRMGEKQREIVGRVLPEYAQARRHRPDRNLHHAVLPSHPAAALRFQHRRRGAPQRAAAAALPLSRRRTPPARTGARVRRAALRRGAGGSLALGGLGLGRSLHPGQRAGFRVGRHR